MPRLMLSDEYWPKLKTIMLQENIYNKPNLRLMVEGMFYRLRVGCPWRDLPSHFGRWNTVYKKYNEWSKKKKWLVIFQKLSLDTDLEWEFIDGSYVKAHQHSAGASSGCTEGIGKSRAGNTSKIHLAVDSYGLPIAFTITGGDYHDSTAARELIDLLPSPSIVIADKGYDSQHVRAQIVCRGANPIIPRRSNSLVGNDDMDWAMYRCRHLVENAFARLKQFRGLATRYDKLKRNYHSAVAMACSFLWLPM